MSTDLLYHYVYRITNIVKCKHYYGKRSCKITPKEDLGVNYFSSSRDKEFINDQKLNPQNYKYKIVSIHTDAISAINKEIKLHNKFDVSNHTCFYNKAKQTISKFDRTGQKHSEETRKNMSNARSGVNNHNYGKTHSEETKRKMSFAQSGKKNHNSKMANIYDRYTNLPIAENIVLSEWCRNNPTYDVSNLSMTTKADRSKPSNGTNRHYHKGIYAQYV